MARTPRARRPSRRDRTAAGVKPGRWEFTARLETPPSGAAPIAASATPGQPVPGGLQTTYTTCVESDNAVPADLGPQCRLERHARRGSQISWSMSCTNTGVRGEGRAQYRGDTMTATVVSHLPGHNGATTDLTQHITGRYLGPCRDLVRTPPAGVALPSGSFMPPAGLAAAASTPGRAANAPSATEAASPAATASVPPPPVPSAAPRSTVARAEDARPAQAEAAPAAAPAEHDEARQTRRSRSGRHAHLHHHGHHQARRSYRSWSSGASTGFGPNPYSGSGP